MFNIEARARLNAVSYKDSLILPRIRAYIEVNRSAETSHSGPLLAADE